MWRRQKQRQHHRCQACFSCPGCPPGTIHDIDDFVLGAVYCKDCDTSTCTVCRKQITQEFCKKNRDASVVLCHACRERGLSLRDHELHKCRECHLSFGATRFYSIQLHNAYRTESRKRKPPTCKSCLRKMPGRFAALRALVKRSTRYCRCSGFCAPGVHLEKCLVSDKESAQRWPGSDTGLTLADFRFLQRQRPHWWRRALGQVQETWRQRQGQTNDGNSR